MAGTDEYMEEAYQTLIHLSADEKKRLEYEVREKALRDYNSQMKSAKQEGRAEGIALGRTQGFAEGKTEGKAEGKAAAIKVIQLKLQGKAPQEIADICNLPIEEVQEISQALSPLPEYEP